MHRLKLSTLPIQMQPELELPHRNSGLQGSNLPRGRVVDVVIGDSCIDMVKCIKCLCPELNRYRFKMWSFNLPTLPQRQVGLKDVRPAQHAVPRSAVLATRRNCKRRYIEPVVIALILIEGSPLYPVRSLTEVGIERRAARDKWGKGQT